MKKCKACGRQLGRLNEKDMLCGNNSGPQMSCTMRCFLFAEERGMVSRPVESDFWSSPEWCVAVDQWLEAQPQPPQS